MKAQLPTLEKECPICKGSGNVASYDNDDGYRACERCSASGFVPTEEGKAVLNLLRHNFRIRSELFLAEA